MLLDGRHGVPQAMYFRIDHVEERLQSLASGVPECPVGSEHTLPSQGQLGAFRAPC
jgi:hypothetical protein